ncbi:hypothetical protein SBP18_18430 [Rhodoferax ferrireducens]|uniref:hypothetical protein n=1 Tax=Rhodoferax ferrireducens TaxID=192843 RepID=UPI00298E055C|nr:hypothetical protein [Rhodoferax ferrireducens]WPC66431.1 hypothetical protein SBP18_18430 [Rhodoferax ferrireducens]
MKTTTILKSISLVAVLGAALAAPVLAQPGPGMWGGMGGMGMQNGGPGPGPGPGAGRMGPGMGDRIGATLMTAEERTAMMIKMRAVKTYDECKLVQDEQHKAMEARAKEKGITLPAPRQNRCDMMKARGLIS